MQHLKIPDSSEGKAWYSYVDESVTLDTLQKLTDEYLQILERSPSKFKSKMKAITTSNGQAGVSLNKNLKFCLEIQFHIYFLDSTKSFDG
jgi:hypothetical protein